MKHPSAVAALLCLALAPSLAQAQATVYRCGQGYQQTPCERGRAVDVDDARSADQRRSAEAVARDEARLGTTLERERRAREREAPALPAAGIGMRATAASDAAMAKPKHRKKGARAERAAGEDFVALEPKRRVGAAQR